MDSNKGNLTFWIVAALSLSVLAKKGTEIATMRTLTTLLSIQINFRKTLSFADPPLIWIRQHTFLTAQILWCARVALNKSILLWELMWIHGTVEFDILIKFHIKRWFLWHLGIWYLINQQRMPWRFATANLTWNKSNMPNMPFDNGDCYVFGIVKPVL